jgi:hypothetical protein
MRLKTNTSLYRTALSYLNVFIFTFDNYDLSKVIYIYIYTYIYICVCVCVCVLKCGDGKGWRRSLGPIM